MSQTLQGLRVVEFRTFGSAPHRRKLFGRYGAEAIKIEFPGASIARAPGLFPGRTPHTDQSALFLYRNTGKKSAVPDPAHPANRECLCRCSRRLTSSSKTFDRLSSRHLGLDHGTVSALNPRLVMVSITPSGQRGPYRDNRGTNLVVFAMGGQMSIVGTLDGGPLKNRRYWADYEGGTDAFSAATLAALAGEPHGVGQHVDISIRRCMATILEASIPFFCYLGQWNGVRRGNHMASFIGICPCADGHIAIHVMLRNWKLFLDVIGRPGPGDVPRFATRANRVKHNDEPMAELYAWAATETKHDVHRRTGAGRAPFAFVHPKDDLRVGPQLSTRSFLKCIEHPGAGEATYPRHRGGWNRATGSPAQHRSSVNAPTRSSRR